MQLMKKNMRALTFFLSLILAGSVLAQKETITLEKLYAENYFRPQTLTRGASMQDGLHYTLLQGGLEINKHAYESGEKLETIFSARQHLLNEEGDPIRIQTYMFSPDESKLLLGTRRESIYRRSYMAEYYIWDLHKQELTLLSEGSRQQLPDFSPDGRMIAFVRDNNIFLRNLQDGREWAVTTDGLRNNIINGSTDWVYEEEFYLTKGFYWSPDSRRLAFYRFDESNVKEFNILIYDGLYPSGQRFKYPKAGEENAHVSIHIHELASGETILVDTGEEKDQYIPRIQWTKNPGLLSVQRLNRHQNKLEILLAKAESGETEILYQESNIFYVAVTDDLHFLEDGKHFVISSEKSGYNHLYMYDMQGRQIRALTSGEWDVEKLLGVDENRGLVYYLARAESPLRNALYAVNLNGRRNVKLTEGKGINNPSFSAGFRYFINEFSTASTPPVFSIHRADGSLVSVPVDNSRLKERIAAHGFVEPLFFKFCTPDSVALNAWMLKPPDFDPEQTYPVLLYVYGGPGSQTVVERWNAFNGVWFQMLAQKGYIVVSVDNRGTGNRGEWFRKMTYLQLGKYETMDQAAAASYLGGLDFVDASRISIFGWSYGGYLSLLCLARAPELFASAISVAPVTNWRFYDTVYTERYMRSPQENPDGYDDNSPINHADKIKGNLLLIHGSADDNVHYQNTMEMSRALIDAGVDFEMMIYPDRDHSIFTRQDRLHLYRLMNDFLDRTIGKRE